MISRADGNIAHAQKFQYKYCDAPTLPSIDTLNGSSPCNSTVLVTFNASKEQYHGAHFRVLTGPMESDVINLTITCSC